MRSRLPLAAGLALSVAAVALSMGTAEASWSSFSATAAAAAMRVTVVAPGGPFAGPNDRIVDVTAFASEAQTNELGASAQAVAAYHGNEGMVAGARGVGPSKLDEVLAPTPLGGLPVTPPSALPLETRAVYPTRPRDTAKSPAAHSAAAADYGNAEASIETGEAVAAARAESSVGIGVDGVLRASATSIIEGINLGPVSIARVESAAAASTRGGRVDRTSTLDIAGLRVGGTEVLVVPNLDQTFGNVRLRVRASAETDTGIRAGVLEVETPLPAGAASTGASSVTYLFGGASAQVAGLADKDGVSAMEQDVSDGLLEDSFDTPEEAFGDGIPALLDLDYGDGPAAEAARAVPTRSRRTGPGTDRTGLGAIAATLLVTLVTAVVLVLRRRRSDYSAA